MRVTEFHSKKSDLVLYVNDQPGKVRQRDLIHVSYDQDETGYIEIIEQLCSQSLQEVSACSGRLPAVR